MESPCIRLCTLDEQDVCIGCNRSMDEITQWHPATDTEKQAIMKRSKARARLRQPNNLSNTSHIDL